MTNFLKELRKELAHLYEADTELLRIAVKDAGLDPVFIDLTQKPIVNSNNVLDEAQKRNRLPRLLIEVLDQYQEPLQLRRLYRQLLLADMLVKTQLPQETLFALARQSLDNQDTLPEYVDSLPSEIDYLCNLVNLLFGLTPRSGKLHLPIFEFVALVCAETTEPFLSELKNWSIQTAASLELPSSQTQVGLPPKPSDGYSLPTAYIAIEIGRAATVPGEPYSLMIRLWYDDAPQPPLFCGGFKSAYTLTEIEQIWNKVFINPDTVSKVSRRPVYLEFIVPNELLSYEFDRWRHPLKKNGETYGMLYPLVVRSWERAQTSFYDYDSYQLWSDRAEFARRDECRFGSQQYTDWLCDPHKFAHTELIIRWRQAKQMVCLKLAYKPTPIPTRSDSAALWIDVGVPVAVWCRQMEMLKLTPTDLRQQVDALFDPHLTLKALPKQFVDLRLQAYNADDQLGSHLTLFWDDVARRPDLQEIVPTFYAP